MREDLSTVRGLQATGVTRRRFPGAPAGLAGAMAVAASSRTAHAADPGSRTRLTLPAPTGPYEIGSVPLHLVDHTRQDPVRAHRSRGRCAATRSCSSRPDAPPNAGWVPRWWKTSQPRLPCGHRELYLGGLGGRVSRRPGRARPARPGQRPHPRPVRRDNDPPGRHVVHPRSARRARGRSQPGRGTVLPARRPTRLWTWQGSACSGTRWAAPRRPRRWRTTTG